MMNVYEQNLYNSIKKMIHMSDINYSELDYYTNDNKIKILILALQWACQSQTYAAIEAGRKIISYFSEDWLKEYLISTSMTAIDINDEWEARRLLELTKGVIPSLTEEVLNYVKASENSEKDELVQDFEN